MLKSLLGIAPKKEEDGSFSPSKLALKLATSDKSDYQRTQYTPYTGTRSTVLVVFTEQKNMTMKNGVQFSTGNHPVEALLPMLHLKSAGFDFKIVTPSGKPVVFEMWAMPTKDEDVMGLYAELKDDLEAPTDLSEIVQHLANAQNPYAAVFIPGGHGAMLGIPDDRNIDILLRWAHKHSVFTISLCHGPGAFLATTLNGQEFLYKGYEIAVFPDSVDMQTPMVGYLPGHMPWQLSKKLSHLGVTLANKKADDTCCIDRELITGASPLAANKLGILAANTLLKELS